MLAACRPVSTPSPPASKPYRRTDSSGMNAWKMPIALEPPPTQAQTASGSRPASAGLRDHPRLSHPYRQQRLTEHVAHLVRTGVVEVLPLEQDPGTDGVGQAGRVVEHARGTGVVAQQPAELGLERLVGLRVAVFGVELVQCGYQCLRHEPP